MLITNFLSTRSGNEGHNKSKANDYANTDLILLSTYFSFSTSCRDAPTRAIKTALYNSFKATAEFYVTITSSIMTYCKVFCINCILKDKSSLFFCYESMYLFLRHDYNQTPTVTYYIRLIYHPEL